MSAPADRDLEIATAPVPQQISYSPKQAAVATGLGESTIRRLVSKGKIAARFYGTSVLVDAHSLSRFVRSLPSERHD